MRWGRGFLATAFWEQVTRLAVELRERWCGLTRALGFLTEEESEQTRAELRRLYSVLWHLLLPQVRKWLGRIVPSHPDDTGEQALLTVLDDIGVRLETAVRTYRGDAPFEHFLRALVARRRHNYIRLAISARRRSRRHLELGDPVGSQGVAIHSPEEANPEFRLIGEAGRSESAAQAGEAIQIYLARYPRNGRTDIEIIGYRVDEKSFAWIGALLGLKENTVNRRYLRAMERLRRILESVGQRKTLASTKASKEER